MFDLDMPPCNFLSRKPWGNEQFEMLLKIAKKEHKFQEIKEKLRLRGEQEYPRPVKGVYGNNTYYILRHDDEPLLAFLYEDTDLNLESADTNTGRLRIMQMFTTDSKKLPYKVSSNCVVIGEDSVLARTLLSWIFKSLRELKRKKVNIEPGKRISDYLTRANSKQCSGFWIETYYSAKEGLLATDEGFSKLTDDEWQRYGEMLDRDNVIKKNVF